MVLVSFFFPLRQALGSLRNGKESVSHTLPGVPHDLQELDCGGCHRPGEELQTHHSQLGLPEAAPGAGHVSPRAAERKGTPRGDGP